MGTLPLPQVQHGGQHSVGRKGRSFVLSEIVEDAESNLHTFWMI